MQLALEMSKELERNLQSQANAIMYHTGSLICLHPHFVMGVMLIRTVFVSMAKLGQGVVNGQYAFLSPAISIYKPHTFFSNGGSRD